MQPFSRSKAVAFWEGVLACAARGERIVLVAVDTDSQSIVGTVQLVLTINHTARMSPRCRFIVAPAVVASGLRCWGPSRMRRALLEGRCSC